MSRDRRRDRVRRHQSSSNGGPGVSPCRRVLCPAGRSGPIGPCRSGGPRSQDRGGADPPHARPLRREVVSHPHLRPEDHTARRQGRDLVRGPRAPRKATDRHCPAGQHEDDPVPQRLGLRVRGGQAEGIEAPGPPAHGSGVRCLRIACYPDRGKAQGAQVRPVQASPDDLARTGHVRGRGDARRHDQSPVLDRRRATLLRA